MLNPQFATIEDIINSEIKLTPMMKQYFDIKKNYPDILLFFRMGDFYELFFGDAVAAAKILNITVTHRGKLGDFKIPMAGIPHHAAHNYIDRITSRGLKVAICEQVEDPKMAQGIVKRAVTQIVSPGIPFNLDKGDERINRYIASATQDLSGNLYLAFVDFTTGEFFGEKINNENDLIQKIDLYKPQEFICHLGQWDNFKNLKNYLENSSVLKTHLSQEYFNPKFTDNYITKIMPTYKADKTLKLVLDILSPIGALSYYICSTQSLEKLDHFKSFRLITDQEKMRVTASTLIGLEILPKAQAQKKNSILGFMDKTLTPMGARALKNLFQNPSRDINIINQKNDAVGFLKDQFELLKTSRSYLEPIRDLDRILAKATTSKINPGDMLNLSMAIEKLTQLQKLLVDKKELLAIHLTAAEKEKLFNLKKFIDEAINEEIGANLDKGNLIKEGFSKKRDKLATMSTSVAKSLLELETQYREKTKISTLKIKSNNIAGYFIEVSKNQSAQASKFFERKQTLKNAERYLSPELKVFEDEIVLAKDHLLQLEREIFTNIIREILELAPVIQTISNKIAEFDILQAFAWIALQFDFTKPIILKDEKVLRLTQAWHPLIKENIKDQFVHHNLDLNQDCFFGLITGPNMAGKTTVMREAAIIQFLAQIGSFVPARKAELGLKDYLFSRLGAHDDITRGQSTFMVEMSETAEIINHASENSLIVLDEIGRGTSTYDGMSIAWALVEYFTEKIKALTLFSTHYHELIDLVQSIPVAKNLTVKTINHKGNVKFLYELIEQGAKQSFGIHVAKMAGLPSEIIQRSTSILKTIEKKHSSNNQLEDQHLLPIFNQNRDNEEDQFNGTLVETIDEIKNLKLNEMTPLQVMSYLNELQKSL